MNGLAKGQPLGRQVGAVSRAPRTQRQTPCEQVGEANEAHKRMYAYAETGAYPAGYKFDDDLRRVGAALDIAAVATR